MAPLPHVYAPTLAQATATAKSVPSAKSMLSSRVASLDGRVEESSTGLPTQNLDMSPFALEREAHQQSNRDRQHGPPARHMELLVVPSQSLTSLLEYHSNNNVISTTAKRSNAQFGGIISRVIKTYELNAKIIHGEPEVPGTTISLTL